MGMEEQNWKFVGISVWNKRFVIGGVNIWDYDWRPISDQFAHVKDPSYKQDFVFQVYFIEVNAIHIEFASGEFSNLVYGFYVKK
ncbi:MAG TPA: hypothetical protein VHM28_06795 [Anaerolineales bacterium]|jgi:hypothetical protein|nr:hypothetical protein [Anaerolineales bacterium]